MPAKPEALEAYWSRDPAALARALGTGLNGLTGRQAARRLRRRGANVVAGGTQATAARLLLRQVQSPLVLILIVAAAISLVVRELVDAVIILAIVLGSVALGFLQEYRASAAVAALRQRLALTVRVLRDGVDRRVPAAEVVPGDIVLLAAGNLVPGDGVVVEARDFLVTEASLTGESFPVEKTPGVVPVAAPLPARTNCVFLGSSVRSGTARALIVHTGRDTALGGIAGRLAAAEEETEFARGVRHFGYLLVRVMLAIVVFVLAVNHWLERPPLESLLFALALAVGISPELLPAIVSVTLSRGARAMASRGVIVRRLEAIEDLGIIDVLCTDKTGTLTHGVVELDGAVDPGGQPAAEVMRLAWLNATLETGIENPLDAAIVAAGQRTGLADPGYAKVDEIPYDFSRKRLTIVAAPPGDPARHLVITKGAFANVLGICTTVAAADGAVPLQEPEREALERFFREQGEAGFRVLALAAKTVPAQQRYAREDEADMNFAGFLLFQDPAKASAAGAVQDLAALGIRVKVVTGDNRHVAAHVGRAIGLDPGAMLTGADVAAMKDEALWQKAEGTDLFVEIDPQQKERIVRALQAKGHAVGYLGDGINDAPALQAADVGISVDQAVDVARESADVVLVQADLDVLRGGVEDGRRTFANTLKYICITTSANFGNMVSMALATPWLPFLPLAAKQILLNNFLSDIPSVFISTDQVDADRLVRAQRWRIGEVRRFMVVFGLLSTLFDLLTFAVLLEVFVASQPVFQTTWFIVSLLTELAVVMVLRTQGPAWRSRPSGLLLWSTAAVCLVALGAPYLGPVSDLFGFVRLDWAVTAAALGIVTAYVLATEIVKLRVFRRTH